MDNPIIVENIVSDGSKLVTQEIQHLLDKAASNRATLVIPAGTYLVGSLFVPSNTTVILEEGACLLGSQSLKDYQIVDTRVAGIDMKWPAAILNVYQATNVKIEGKGNIDGQGEVWWNSFWGQDEQSGMMADYISKNLRWAVDYDCFRPRNICVYRSKSITLCGISSVQSGFWNTHICYSKSILLDGLYINNDKGPSTDGIDIDSCESVIVQNCYVAGNDDNICIKSGRGSEAHQNKTRCKNILIQNCVFGAGSGVTLGSETSGGIEQIVIRDITFNGTGVGFRIKSANNRGGHIAHVKVSNLTMYNVAFPFLIQTNWYPEYSYSKIPENYQGEVPDYWHKLLQGGEDKLGITQVKNIEINGVKATIDENLTYQASRAFFIDGNRAQNIEGLVFRNIKLCATEYGKIAGVNSLEMENVNITAPEQTQDKNDVYER